MRGRDLAAAIVKDGTQVVAGLWTGEQRDTFTFDVAVDAAHQRRGLGLHLARLGRCYAGEQSEIGRTLELTAIGPGGEALARKLDLVETERRGGIVILKEASGTRDDLNAAALALIGQIPSVAAGSICGGWAVRDKIDNLASICATLGSDYETHGVREVPISLLGPDPGPGVREKLASCPSVVALAERMKASGELTPLIVVINGLCPGQDGPAYVLEGCHRIDSLEFLGARSFPALVVQDTNPVLEVRDEAGRLLSPAERFALPSAPHPTAPETALLQGKVTLPAPATAPGRDTVLPIHPEE